MGTNLLSFEVIDLNELVEFSSGTGSVELYDGCGGFAGACDIGCGCGWFAGACGKAKPSEKPTN